MSCIRFCNGAENTRNGMVTKGLNIENKRKLFPHSNQNVYDCPLGCTANPMTVKAFNNIVANGDLHTICHNNEFRAH